MTQTAPTLPLTVDEAAVRARPCRRSTCSARCAACSRRSPRRAVQPPQTLTLFPDQAGDFITYLGALADAHVFGAKLSPYVVTGGKPDGRPIVTAWTALMSMRTGQPLMWCDAGLLTVERTAGTTALAVDCLAPRAAISRSSARARSASRTCGTRRACATGRRSACTRRRSPATRRSTRRSRNSIRVRAPRRASKPACATRTS